MKKFLVSLIVGFALISGLVMAGSFEDSFTRTYILPNLQNFPTASLPAAAIAGRMAYDTTLSQLTIDNGSAWVSPFGTNLSTGSGASTVGSQLRIKQSVAPTCSNNCGTSVPAVAGSDSMGTIQMGSGGSPTSPFTMTFNGTWPAVPSCVVQRATGTAANVVQMVAPTTTTVVVTVATGIGTGDKFNYICGLGS